MKKGFTLIEVIIYIALFALLMTGALVATFQLLEGGSRNQKAVAIQEEGTFLYRKINWALSGATGATLIDPQTLSVTRPDLGSESPLIFASSANYLTLARGSGSPAVLNSDYFKVSDVSFNVTTLAGVGTSVTALFNVEHIPFVFQTYLR